MVSRTDYSHNNETASRNHGSIKQQISSVHGQHEMTMDKKRVYMDGSVCKETATTTSFDAHTVNIETATCLFTGKVLHEKDQYGNEAVFRYDTLGRLVEKTVSPRTEYEASRKTLYAVAADGVGYIVTETDTKGSQTRYSTDGMERVVRVERQSVVHHQGTSMAVGPFQVMQESFYNAVGQCIQVDKMDWLGQDDQNTSKQIRAVTKMEYDDWGTMCRSTDATGTVNLVAKDPISMIQTTGMAGKGRTETKLNISGKPIEVLLRKSDGAVHQRSSYMYDGWDRLIEKRDALNRITKYIYDSFDRVVETLGPDDSISKTEYASYTSATLPTRMESQEKTLGKLEYDGLARSTTKTVGKRTSVAIYDTEGPRPTQITMADGNQHSFSYEPALHHALVKRKGAEGEVAFQYDKQTSALLRFESEVAAVSRAYSPSGLLAEETFEMPDGRTLSASSTYSTAGLPCSYVDVHGHKREIEYDGYGRVLQLTQGTVKVHFEYNQENLVSKTSIRDDGGGQEGHGLQIQVLYNDFGHEVERCVRHGGDGPVIYRIRRMFNVANLITWRIMEDAQGHVLRDEAFEYDIRDRLVSYLCKGSQSPEDENGWKLHKQSFNFDGLDNLIQIHTSACDGAENTRNYLYDPEDPTKLIWITNTNKELPEVIDLLYDSNGCLVGHRSRLRQDPRPASVRRIDGHKLLRCQSQRLFRSPE
ncbi:unnamed protein product [Periconia digitata]|uniref:Uncharacterized protein n=1 Tax=Periconia digitata TaxID=1303443 RepID=A0A9W4UWQ5_9PLEO|nr:unnamed protein product [Periconia digitata]